MPSFVEFSKWFMRKQRKCKKNDDDENKGIDDRQWRQFGSQNFTFSNLENTLNYPNSTIPYSYIDLQGKTSLFRFLYLFREAVAMSVGFSLHVSKIFCNETTTCCDIVDLSLSCMLAEEWHNYEKQNLLETPLLASLSHHTFLHIHLQTRIDEF